MKKLVKRKKKLNDAKEKIKVFFGHYFGAESQESVLSSRKGWLDVSGRKEMSSVSIKTRKGWKNYVLVTVDSSEAFSMFFQNYRFYTLI